MKDNFVPHALAGGLFAALAVVISWFVNGAWEEWDNAIGFFGALLIMGLPYWALTRRRERARNRGDVRP